jgi:hypothetical protein
MDSTHLYLTHLHLLLNHVPTVAFAIALFLFLWSQLAKNDSLQRASLVLFAGIALLAIPTYVSGNAAAEALCVGPETAGVTAKGPCEDSAVSLAPILTHESAALIALLAIQITGVLAWLGLWQVRRIGRIARWNITAVLALALVSMGLVTRAANFGGDIRHAEIRETAQAPTAPAAPGNVTLARSVGSWVTSSPFAWPALETLHFIGLTLLIGVVLLIDLRMLGVMRGVAFPSLHRLLPWAILGFALNAVTGMLFFVAIPDQYAHNIAFIWKLAFMMVAGANAFYFTLFDEAWALQPGDEAPFTAKAAAVSALVLWVGVLYFGSMLPFLGDSF